MEMRECRHHGLTEFRLYGRGRRNGRVWRCKRCTGEAVTRRHQRLKRRLAAESGGCCACGYSRCIVNLVFHMAEMAKCVLVCANCHGEIEAGVIPSPPAQALYRPAAA